jgi:SOS response regulatory protein OraA/RecX
VADQPEEVTRLMEAIKAFEAIEDDEACAVAVSQALAHWTDQQPRLRELRQRRVQALKTKGMTWEEIGRLLGGISAARAQQIAAGVSGAQRRKAEGAAKKAKPGEPTHE